MSYAEQSRDFITPLKEEIAQLKAQLEAKTEFANALAKGHRLYEKDNAKLEAQLADAVDTLVLYADGEIHGHGDAQDCLVKLGYRHNLFTKCWEKR